MERRNLPLGAAAAGAAAAAGVVLDPMTFPAAAEPESAPEPVTATLTGLIPYGAPDCDTAT